MIWLKRRAYRIEQTVLSTGLLDTNEHRHRVGIRWHSPPADGPLLADANRRVKASVWSVDPLRCESMLLRREDGSAIFALSPYDPGLGEAH